MINHPILRSAVLLLSVAAALAPAATYRVGPGRQLQAIRDVPWATLMPGDTVLIDWRPTPYREKWVITRQGTANAPITIQGMLGPGGARPVITGEDATTPSNLDFWNQERGVLKIGGSSIPANVVPQHLVIDSLDIRGARKQYGFTTTRGVRQSYNSNAAAIYVENAQNLTIRNCYLQNSANGLFVGVGSTSSPSRDVLVERNLFLNNGNSGSSQEHNSYTEAQNIVFQYNQMGPLMAGSQGNNLKDRSAGLVVRYNWIEGGNRQLDLVDSQYSILNTLPSYRQTHVYGNILIEPSEIGNQQIVHYGGDSGKTYNYRKGTLYFYHNTAISYRKDATVLMNLSTNEERSDARNNVYHVTTPNFGLLDANGRLELRTNWIRSGYRSSLGNLYGTISDSGTITGSDPLFASIAAKNYRPGRYSPLIDKAAPLPPEFHEVKWQYSLHLRMNVRVTGKGPDFGALER